MLPTAGRDPGSRAPAPGSLRLVQALVNTLNAETGRDLLGTAAEAARWLAAGRLMMRLPGSPAPSTLRWWNRARRPGKSSAVIPTGGLIPRPPAG